MSNYYPPTAFSFAVRLIGPGAEAIDGAFQEVSGLGDERQVRELEEGGENRFVHKLPGSIKHSNLVLKRGQLAHKSRLFAWCHADIGGEFNAENRTARHQCQPFGIKRCQCINVGRPPCMAGEMVD